MQGINLWLYLEQAPGVVGVPSEDYDTGGSWEYYQNGVGNSPAVAVSNPSDIALDGIAAQNINSNTQFLHCIGAANCKNCTAVGAVVTPCEDGQGGCTDCLIALQNYTVQCNGGDLQVCALIQANECANSPTGDNTIQFSALLDDGSGTFPAGGTETTQLNTTGAGQTICMTISNVGFEVKSIKFGLVFPSEGGGQRQCFQEVTVPGANYPNPSTVC